MIEFIGNNIRDISYWLMFLAAVGAYILLYYQKKAYRNVAEKHRALSSYIVDKETELLSIINTVNDFIEEHNSWHDRKICLYYNKDGWNCCYADEIPNGDTFTDQEEITQQNGKEDENK